MFEQQGVPSASIITDVFRPTGTAMAKAWGLPDFRFIAIPHPIANLTEQQLDQRAREVLRALVQDHIHTGEPVASQPLLARHDLDCSPATIRNIMADLEEMGYVAPMEVQTKTFRLVMAGRDIMVQAWYQGGVSVFDFTDSAKPVELAYFDRGPVFADKLVTAGQWSTYWYNGLLYGSEIHRGLADPHAAGHAHEHVMLAERQPGLAQHGDQQREPLPIDAHRRARRKAARGSLPFSRRLRLSEFQD